MSLRQRKHWWAKIWIYCHLYKEQECIFFFSVLNNINFQYFECNFHTIAMFTMMYIFHFFDSETLYITPGLLQQPSFLPEQKIYWSSPDCLISALACVHWLPVCFTVNFWLCMTSHSATSLTFWYHMHCYVLWEPQAEVLICYRGPAEN